MTDIGQLVEGADITDSPHERWYGTCLPRGIRLITDFGLSAPPRNIPHPPETPDVISFRSGRGRSLLQTEETKGRRKLAGNKKVKSEIRKKNCLKVLILVKKKEILYDRMEVKRKKTKAKITENNNTGERR
ncbi:hypothetical protein AVEN_20985-1 [Araneus ventricosus]|uniref:Uncharacterized protein n=1 Tax=Araneus ventricosus TaxID=182803 RepID=A0A4Y2WCD6_ARAVE|nr:hypothetical protein AVEN_20985-1 [Araneus ventricosus]